MNWSYDESIRYEHFTVSVVTTISSRMMFSVSVVLCFFSGFTAIAIVVVVFTIFLYRFLRPSYYFSTFCVHVMNMVCNFLVVFLKKKMGEIIYSRFLTGL